MRAQRTLVKICGLTRDEDVHAAADAGADLVGFVLWPGSVRALPLERAAALAAVARSRGLESVALVVDATPAELAALAGFDRVQCHGAESCAALAAVRDLSARPVIKGFPFSPESLRAWDACPHVDWLLVDGPRGGSGQAFDHAALVAHRSQIAKPIVLAGGLTAENVAHAVRLVRPFAVDVSSGVERDRGIKDARLIERFCRAVREVDAA